MVRKFFIVLLLLFGEFSLGLYAAENEVLWEKVSDNNYINPDGITGTDDMYGFTFLLKSYNKGQYEPVNGKKISYTIGRYSIDCGRYTYKIGVIDSYGTDDNFITGDYNRYAKFQPIVEGTAVGNVAKRLCRPLNH